MKSKMERNRTQRRLSPVVLSLLVSLLLGSSATWAGSQEAGKKPEPQKEGSAAPAQNPAAAGQPAAPGAAAPAEKKIAPQRVVKEGVAIEFSIEPLNAGRELMDGEDAVVRFKINDTATNNPLTGVRPAAWIDHKGKTPPSGDKDCREKIKAFLQASIRTRADVDLNTYFIITLNKEANISVIDPLMGFGTSKLLTLVFLNNPGEDWVLSNNERLFVTVPLSNQVAVVDTNMWKVLKTVDAGVKPARIALQSDRKYVWVGNDADAAPDSGVTVIDAAEMKTVAKIPTGAGGHQIALSPDDRFAFVTNRLDGTLSVIDVQKLAKVQDVKIGKTAGAVAFSPLSRAVYVTDEATGEIVGVDSQSHQVIARIKTKPGLGAIRFAPGGRYGFAVNPKEDAVFVFDSSTNNVIQTVPVDDGPDQVSFTKAFAYVRSARSEQVTLIPLAGVGKDLEANITTIPGGQTAPDQASTTQVADSIVPAPEGNAVLIANPADKMIYFYTEGMAAPMGNFQNYRRELRGVLVVDRSLRETMPGVYSTNVRFDGYGEYDVAFLIDNPRIVNCFDLEVKENPAIKKRGEVALQIEHLIKDTRIPVRENVTLRFKLLETGSARPKTGLKDVNVLTFLAPGIWQKRQWATSVGDGVYEVSFVPPETGVYYVFVECASMGVRFNQLPFVVLDARDEKPKANDAPAAPAKP
ncbi:MAG TPA: cytochrome D1 domain-containing protein [Blastocatellia bacterium]|nr:cytochrome D1 domain-containing protein [Blastocatellia bacterium]